MKRLIIICEGETEQEYCKKILFFHFMGKGIFLQYPLFKKSKGGIIPWDSMKKQIEMHLKESNVWVTTFMDYYGIPDSFKFPKWKEAKGIVDANKRMDFLEEAMKQEIFDTTRYRFIPYLQLHEFEGLLFNNMESFDSQINETDYANRAELERIIDTFPNPELINNNPETAPSKRLEKLIIGYKKVTYGHYLAEAIGLQNIRNKCPRFNAWLTQLENI